MALSDLVPWKRRERDLDVPRGYGNPFGVLTEEMSRLFDDFRGRFDIEPFGFPRGQTGDFMPSVDITDADKEVRVTCELPGIDEKDIDITLSKDAVTIRGEKKQEKEHKERGYYHVESSYGSFRRDIHLSSDVDASKVEAICSDGILSITLPKAEEAKTIKVKVKD